MVEASGSARRQGEILAGVLRVLSNSPDPVAARVVIKRVEETVPPTEIEKSDYPKHPGLRRWDKIVRFYTIGAVKAGWIVKSKGQWNITDEGRRALGTFKDPEALQREEHRLYRQWKASQPDDNEVEPEEDPASVPAFEEAEENAWTEVSGYLEEMNPFEFQDLVAALLGAMGYHIAWKSEPGPDKGLDILAYTDVLGATGPRIKVQVKRRADKITADGLKSFLAILGDHDVGIFVATGGFTRDAEIEWRAQERRKVTLIDMRRLFDLWVEHYERLKEEAKALLPLKRVYYLAPRE